MAVDSLLNSVVELTQGGSTTNQVLPPVPRQRTLTGITAGADHMVFAPDGVFESKDGRTAARYNSPPYANIEFVVELDPVWAMGALIAKGYMWSLTCAESGVLRITLGYAGNVELSDLVVPTTGKLYVSIRLLKDDSYDLLDFFIDVQPEAGTRRTWVRQGTLSSSILMLTWVNLGRWADVVLGAQAHDVKVAAPAGVASASWVIATQGYGAAYSAARSTYSESFPYIIGVSYTPPDNPNNIREDNYWRTLGAQAFDNGVALGPPVVVSLSLPKNSMTRFQASTVLLQQLAALLPGAVVTTDTWGDPPVTLHVMETTESGYQRPTAETYQYTQINERAILGLPHLTSPTQTWVVRGRENYLNDSPVTDWAQMYGKTVTPGVYGSGTGSRTVTRLTVNKYTSDPCTLLLASVTYPMTSIAIGGDLHTALTTNWPNTTATALNANTTVFNLPLIWVGPLLTPLTLPNVYITSSPVSAIDKLYALRVTEAAREADAAFPALPWPTTSIPPDAGAIVGPTPISASPLYLKFEDGASNATAKNDGAGGGAFSVGPHAIVSSQHQDGVGSLQLTGAAYDSMSFASITGPLTGDYTAEMWVRFPALPATTGMFMSPYTHGFALGATGVLSLFTDSGSSSLNTATSAVSANVWYHIAAVRTSGTVKFYFNGVSQDVGATGQTSSVAAPFALGEDGSYGSGVAAFIDEYRFTNSALYTANFTPESPLDSTPIVAPTNDVTGAGYNDIEELLGSGTGNTQDYFPDAYGTSNTTLDDAEAAYTAYVDAADITGTGTTTLAAYTNSGAGAAAIPTDITADYTFDDFTSAADGVADLPLEVTADYTFEDIVSISVGLFLSPAEGSGDSVLDDFAVTAFTASIITPPSAQATFSLPALRATASGTPTVFDGALLTLPALTAAAQGGHYSEFSLPMITAEATGTTIAMARAIMTIPMVEVEASGRVSGQSSVQARLPSIEVTSFGGHQAEITLPEITATATATVGSAAQAEFSLPRITVTAHGYRDDTARADITLPMLVMTPSAVAEITLPAFTVLAHGQPVLTNAYEAYVLNMNQPLDDNPRNNFEAKVEQVTRYTNWPFIQVVRLGSTYYGVAEDGLYELGGTTDNGTEITWSFETCKTDFDDPHKKAVASAYIGGQAGATVDYTLRSGDDVDHMYGYVTTKVIQKRNHRQKFGLGRRVRYYSFGLAGSGKAAIDMLEFELLNTTRRI